MNFISKQSLKRGFKSIFKFKNPKNSSTLEIWDLKSFWNPNTLISGIQFQFVYTCWPNGFHCSHEDYCNPRLRRWHGHSMFIIKSSQSIREGGAPIPPGHATRRKNRCAYFILRTSGVATVLAVVFRESFELGFWGRREKYWDRFRLDILMFRYVC